MNAIFETVNSLGNRFVDFAWPMLIQSSVLILILLLADVLLRKKVRAVFRYWLWVVVLLKLVLPTSLSSPVSIGRWFGEEMAHVNLSERIVEPYVEAEVMPPVLAAEELITNPEHIGTDVHATAVSPNFPVTTVETVSPEVESAPAAHEQIAPPPQSITSLSSQGIVFLLWLAVVITMGLLLLQRAAVVRSLVAQAKEADDSITKLLKNCCKRVRIGGKVGLKISVKATSPAVCGLFRPVILVPENLTPSLSSNQLRVILLHELAHIERGDLWINLAQTILQIIYFYNPLLWLANAIIRRAREQAVDETVLVAMGEKAGQYPQTLVDVAKLAFMRPALSLRLIGIVESRDALTGRIKRILSRPLPKSARLGILSLLVIFITAAILLPMAKAMEPKPSVVNNGPLDIRLIGVCPDGGEQMYDPSGRKIKTTLGPLGISGYWKDEDQQRDFLFEVSDVNDQLIFLPGIGVYMAGTNRGLGGGSIFYFNQTDNPSTFIYSSTFDRFCRNRIFNIPLKKKIRYIDLTLRYLYGPRRQAICVFTGPFKMNQTVEADEGKPYYLTFQEGITIEGSGIILRFETSERFDRNAPAILYDLNSRRYVLDDKDSSRNGDKMELQYHRVVVLPENIAAVTFGEKPREITFKNIAVDYPGQSHRTYPEFFYEMSKRLGLTNKSPKVLANYGFRNSAEAIEVIDIIRGEQQIRKAFEAIRYGKPVVDITRLDPATQDIIRRATKAETEIDLIKLNKAIRVKIPRNAIRWTKVDITELDEVTQDRIRRTAKTWAEIDILAVYGIQLGLMGQWPEFFDMAIERLGRDAPYGNGYTYYERTWRQDNGNIANTMANYRMNQLTVEQVQKLKELILKTDNGSVSNQLLYYLDWTKSQTTTDALWELAQSEKPWIWWQATEAWYSRESRIRDIYDRLPEKMKLRLILVERNVKDENLKAKVLELLPEILTPEMAKMAFSLWFKVYEGIASGFNKTDATDIYINCLRRMQSEMTVRQWTTNNAFKSHTLSAAAYLIRTLNVWYAVNIGNLGTDEMRDTYIHTSIRTFLQFQALITEALQWYDGDKEKTPVELPFAGKVVNTSGIPVVGAELRLIKIENYEDEYGRQELRRVSIGQCRSDADGRFSFNVEENGEHYLFDITAEGFVPKQILDVQRLTDGRYLYREEAALEDNVVVLQRPGKISGIVIGANSKPLPNAELTLFTVNLYSNAGITRRTFRTNSEGKFTAYNITKGHFLLSYTDLLQMVPHGRGFRQEYGGLCGIVRLEVEEAEHLTDVVLDLSKSDCSLELQVVGDANEPVQNISFSLDAGMGGGNYKYASIFSVREVSKDGIYFFEGMPHGAWRLYISDNSKRSWPKEIDIDLTRGKTARYKVMLE